MDRLIYKDPSRSAHGIWESGRTSSSIRRADGPNDCFRPLRSSKTSAGSRRESLRSLPDGTSRNRGIGIRQSGFGGSSSDVGNGDESPRSRDWGTRRKGSSKGRHDRVSNRMGPSWRDEGEYRVGAEQMGHDEGGGAFRDTRSEFPFASGDSMNGYLYLIEAPSVGRFKIGYSRNPQTRLRELQTGSPVELILRATIPTPVAREVLYHLRLREFRIRGEWFRRGDWIDEFIGEGPIVWHCRLCGSEILDEIYPLSCYISQNGCSRPDAETNFHPGPLHLCEDHGPEVR